MGPKKPLRQTIAGCYAAYRVALRYLLALQNHQGGSRRSAHCGITAKPRTAQHQVGGLFQLSPDCLYPFRFRYLGLRVTGDRSYILLHCFNRLEMVFPDLSAHAGPVTLRRVIPVDATEKQKAIKC